MLRFKAFVSSINNELIKNIMKVNGFTVETPEAQKCQVDRSKLEDKAFI